MLADLVANSEGTTSLFNGVGSLWQMSINGLLGKSSTGTGPVARAEVKVTDQWRRNGFSSSRVQHPRVSALLRASCHPADALYQRRICRAKLDPDFHMIDQHTSVVNRMPRMLGIRWLYSRGGQISRGSVWLPPAASSQRNSKPVMAHTWEGEFNDSVYQAGFPRNPRLHVQGAHYPIVGTEWTDPATTDASASSFHSSYL